MPKTPDTVTLFRPVNQAELELVAASGYSKFPPRLPEQPIFYPVTNEEYASQIARDWNVPAYGSGFVLRFEVASDFLARYQVHTVGERHHSEYWIPAEKLGEFNDSIVGQIEVIQKYGKI